jgi:hypothetical protein
MLRNRPEAAEHSRETIDVARRVDDAFAEVNGRINLFTVLASNFAEPPDPGDVLHIVEQASAAGALEESARAVINFIWSSVGFLPAEQIEATAITGLDGRPPPPSIAAYAELSLIAKVLIPRLEAIEPGQLTAAAKLVQEPVLGALALRRGDLGTAARLLADVKAVALESGEVQRIVPMACAVVPWLHLAGRREELREATDEILDSVGDLWPVVLTTDPMARALDAAGEAERLAALAESLAGAAAPIVGRLANNLVVAESLLALREGRADEAAERLGEAKAEERMLGFAFDGACIALDQARALEAAGQAEEAVRVRSGAEELMWALDCVNPF